MQMYKCFKQLITGDKTDDLFPFVADAVAVPDQLLRFVPIDAGVSTGPPHWIVDEDISTQCIEVRRQKFFPMQSICLGVVLFVIGVSVFVYLNVLLIGKNAPLISLIVLNFGAVVIPLAMSVGAVGMYAWACYANSRYWKGSLYFRYKLVSHEFFFPRENHVYRQNDCKRIMLGFIIGYDTRLMWKQFGIPVAGGGGGGKSGQMSHNARSQCFVLIQTNADEWKRYEIGYDLTRAKKQFNKLVSILQPLTNCEVFYRKYSLLESFDEQHGKIGT
jgi:hypothetical protein